jgi:hypothetical protein
MSPHEEQMTTGSGARSSAGGCTRGEPEDAAVAAFLASGDSASVTGSTSFVDGNLTGSYQE